MQVLDSHEKTGRSKVTPTIAKADPLYLVDLQAQSRPSHAYDDDVSVSKSLSATAPMKNLNRDPASPNTRNTTADKLAACFTTTYPASASALVSLTHGVVLRDQGAFQKMCLSLSVSPIAAHPTNPTFSTQTTGLPK